MFPPLAQTVQSSGNEFLARTALPQDQDRRIGLRHRLDKLAQFNHARGFADDLLQPIWLSPTAGAQKRVLLQQPVTLGAARHGVQQFFRRKRFGEIIDRSGLDRFDGQLWRGVGRNHQHRHLRPGLAHST